MVKIKVKVGAHLLSPNTGRYIIFGRKPVIDGIQAPYDVYKLSVGLPPLTMPIVEGPYYNKSVWRQLKELINR